MFRNLVFLSLVIMLTGVPALAEDEPAWGNVQHWTIRVDRTLNFSCFLHTAFDKGTVFRLGFDRTRTGKGYVMIGNSKWDSLEIGKEYSISLKFDKEIPWDATSRAINIGTAKYLYISFGDARFIEEFSSKHHVTILYSGAVVTSLPLVGTAAATAELVKCQNKMDELARGNPSNGKAQDPFGNPPIQQDPFRSNPPIRAIDPFKRG